MSKFVAFIPLRGGSKGIPGKNIKQIAGRPLLQYVTEAALAADEIEHIVISTDSDDIRQTVKRLYRNNEKVILFNRLPSTATDDATTESAMLDFAERSDLEFDHVILIQATSPLLQTRHLVEGIAKYKNDKLGGLVSVVEQNRFLWKDGKPMNYNPLNRSRRQGFEGHTVENGAFYITGRQLLLKNKCRISKPYGTYVMPWNSYYEIDEPEDWEHIEHVLVSSEMKRSTNQLPRPVKAVVFDFDGVFTDNKVIVQQNGEEAIVCDRGDGMGISKLRKLGIDMWVISKEQNPVLKSRCEKLKIPCIHGVDDKWTLLRKQLHERSYRPEEVVYVGNDVNDIECILHVGCGVAVADSHPDVLKVSDLILTKNGGNGAIRELCDMILKSFDSAE